MMAAKCKKFEPNVFNKNKCGVCFKSKSDHSASALESAKAARKITKYGYLFIAPDLSARRWQRRFFILYDDGELTYSIDESADTVPQGVIDVNQCEEILDAEESSGHEFSFAIVVPPDTHYVKSPSREESTRWMDALLLYVQENREKPTLVNTKRPTPSSSSSQDVSCSEMAPLVAPPAAPPVVTLVQPPVQASIPPSVPQVTDKAPPGQHTKPDNSPQRPNLQPQPAVRQPRLSLQQQQQQSVTPAPTTSQFRQRAKSQTQLTTSTESGDDLHDKFLREDWYKPVNNNQSSLGNFNSKRRHASDVTSIITSDTSGSNTSTNNINGIQSTNSTRQSTEARVRLSRDRRKTQPEIRYTQPVEESSRPRGRTSNDTAPGGPPPSQERRRSRSLLEPPKMELVQSGETDESKLAKALNEQSRTSQGSTDSETPMYMKKGWLHKLTANGEWSKHWFVLCGQALKYYRDSRAEDINDLDGRIDLKFCLDAKEVDTSKNYGLQVKNRNGTYTLSAMTAGIRSNWLHAIQTFVQDDSASQVKSEPAVPVVIPSRRRGSRPQLQRRNTVPANIMPSDMPDSKSYPDPSDLPLSPDSVRSHDISLLNSPSAVTQDSIQSYTDTRDTTNRVRLENRSQLIVDGRPSDSRTRHESDSRTRHESDASSRSRVDSDTSVVSALSVGEDTQQVVKKEQNSLPGKSPIEKKLDKLRSKVVLRVKSPPPKLASEVLKKAAESPVSGTVVKMLETEVDHLQVQLEKAHGELVYMHEENSKLKSKFKHAKRKIKEAEESSQPGNHSMEEHMRELKTENSAHISEKSLLKLEVENLRQENDLLQVKLRKLSDDNGGMKKSFQAVSHENSSIRNEMKSLQSQMTKLQEANTGKHDELTELVQKVDEYRTESRKHKKSCREKDSQLLELSEELQHKCEDYEDLTKRYNILLNDMDTNKSFQTTSVKMEKELSTSRQELNKKNRDYAEVMNRYNELSSENQNMKSSLQDAKKITTNYVSNLKEHETLIKNLRQELENRTMDLASNEKQRQVLELEITDSKMTLKDSLHILDSQKSRVDEKDKQISEMRKLVEERNALNDDQINKYEDLLSQHDKLMETRESEEDELTRLGELLDERTRECQDWEEKYNNLLCELENKHDLSLLDQLEDREDEVEKLKDEVQERTDDCEEMALRVDQLERELANTRMELIEKEHECGKPQTKDFGCGTFGDGFFSSQDSASCPSAVISPVLVDCFTQTVDSDACVRVSTTEACFIPETITNTTTAPAIPPSHSLVQRLKSQLNESEKCCDELDIRNARLKAQIHTMIDRYNDEVRFYSSKIDDLVRKLRAEQTKKQKKDNSVESMLTGIEDQVKQAERALAQQTSVEDTIVHGLNEIFDDTRSDASTSDSDNGEYTATEIKITNEDDDGEITPVEEYDDALLTRIQCLHDRVSRSNAKLTDLFQLIDESRDDDTDSVTSSLVSGRLRECESRLSSVHSQLKEQEAFNASTDTLKSLVENHQQTLSVLDECESGLLESLSGLNGYDGKREKLQTVIKTVNEMMDYASRERDVIAQSKMQIEEALKHPRSIGGSGTWSDGAAGPGAVNVFAENVTLKSLLSGQRKAAQSSRHEGFTHEHEHYFLELQTATQRIGELEEQVEHLRNHYAKQQRDGILLTLSDAVETYANVVAESIVHDSLSQARSHTQLRKRGVEKNQFIREMQLANCRIRELENTVQITADRARSGSSNSSGRDNIINAQSFNQYMNMVTRPSEIEVVQSTINTSYESDILAIRNQQLNEFSQFSERLRGIESQIFSIVSHSEPSTPTSQNVESSFGESRKLTIDTQESSENWTVFSQASSLVGKAMGQAELVLKLHQLRSTLLVCTSKHDQMRLLNKEIDVSLSRLRSREKLMTDCVDKYKLDKLQNIGELIEKRGYNPHVSLAQCLHALITRLAHLVTELSSFYKSMDMIGDSPDLRLKLDACISKELELVSHELDQNCRDTSSRTPDLVLSEEMISSVLYNLADLLAQRAMVEAQFQYVSEVLHKQKIPTRESCAESSAVQASGGGLITEKNDLHGSTMSLPSFSSQARRADILVMRSPRNESRLLIPRRPLSHAHFV